MSEKKKASIGGIVMIMLKLPFRIAALPLLAALLIVRLASALITGLSSIVTNLLGTAALAAAAGIWMFSLGTNQDAFKMIGFALVFFLTPHIADWLVEKATDLGTSMVAFLLG